MKIVLFFGKEINNARCWFQIKGIGTIQPSEFMKIILIITLGKMINKFKTKLQQLNPTQTIIVRQFLNGEKNKEN